MVDSFILLTPDAKLFFRNDLRRAVAAAQRDAEGYQQILFAVERLGSTLSGAVTSLSAYQSSIEDFLKASPMAAIHESSLWGGHLSFSEIYAVVREARNDAMHGGAAARHATTIAIHLALILQEALMSDAKYVRDYMVRHPICAHPWQPVGLARQEMLTNGFTDLPIRIEIDGKDEWRLVSDFQVARYLRQQHEIRNELLARKTSMAVASGDLILETPKFCRENQKVTELTQELSGVPFLVLNDEEPGDLAGILAPFDLL